MRADKRVHERAALGVGLVLVLAGLACGGSDSGGPPASGLRTVLVANNEFQPVSVSIAAGDTILWSWVSNALDHNIISTGASSFAGVGGIGTTFAAPMSHQVVFNTAGTYEYYCSTHGTTGGAGGNTGMHGQVVVAP